MLLQVMISGLKQQHCTDSFSSGRTTDTPKNTRKRLLKNTKKLFYGKYIRVRNINTQNKI